MTLQSFTASLSHAYSEVWEKGLRCLSEKFNKWLLNADTLGRAEEGVCVTFDNSEHFCEVTGNLQKKLPRLLLIFLEKLLDIFLDIHSKILTC